MLDINEYLKTQKQRIDTLLDRHLPSVAEAPERLHEAMRYSVMAGGKRLRPALYGAAAEAIAPGAEVSYWPALAIEILHTYTLIHDDLPAMDDDDLRRGKPALHKAFDEATAILAGDALLTLAFEWTAQDDAPPPYKPQSFTRELAQAAGHGGVIAGQVADLDAEDQEPNESLLRYIHERKTARLIQAALRMGGIAAGADAPSLKALTRIGLHTGVAFQMADDILDETADTETIGKPAGSDLQQGKMTCVALYGLDGARAAAQKETEAAQEAASALPGNTAPLQALMALMANRTA